MKFHNELDLFLSGGVPCGQITEFSGAAGLGKTQLCFQLALSNCLQNKCNGVLYVDSEGAFSATRFLIRTFKSSLLSILVNFFYRLLEIAIHKFNLSENDQLLTCMNQIHVWRPHSLKDIMER